ncbi:MAG: DUF4386 domain-containing protein [Proteobacteria bacterium]|nr:DUF4386 domain-containing protein [Pseudomonadota bacterium]
MTTATVGATVAVETTPTLSQRRAAKIAALAYLATLAIVITVNFGIHGQLIVANNIVETSRKILAHQQLFRIGIAGYLAYCAGGVVLLVSQYTILGPVNRNLALLAALWRLMWVVTWLALTLNLVATLKLLTSADALQTLEPGQLQGLAYFYLRNSVDDYYAALLFGGLASTAAAYLWFKSRYISRLLAAFGIIASLFAVACTAVYLVVPQFATIVNLWWFDTPMAIFDIALSLRLLFKGLRSIPAEKTATVHAFASLRPRGWSS